MIDRSARYLLTRLFFLMMGLPVSQYRSEVEHLWRLKEDARLRVLDRLLAQNRPLNSSGEEVAGLDSLRSSPTLSKRQLQALTSKNQRKNEKVSFGRHTAGTTGDPAHVSLNRKELAQMLGVRDYCLRHYGLALGQREARLWGRAEAGFKSSIKNFLMNRRIFHPVGPQAENELVALSKWRPDYLYGYSSLLLEAAKILDRMDIQFEAPRCVICTAESILPTQKAFISKVFKAPVAEEYGSTEFDVIAFECVNGHRHLVNPWLIVEEDKENGVISDVSRMTQNLVRYEQGDYFTKLDSDCQNLGSTVYLEELHGRTIDLFFYINQEEKVHIISIARIFDCYFNDNDDIFSFQLEQNTYSVLEVNIDKEPAIGLDGLNVFIEMGVREITGASVTVRISIRKYREQPTKRNYFIQNMSLEK
ncbi:CoF synthetase [uncultured Marinobacter sp.]|uniref:CoF synthetase n=1 Tax=uncultured Marinobacter sp. TaxID=187379 RepID=UPI0030C838FF